MKRIVNVLILAEELDFMTHEDLKRFRDKNSCKWDDSYSRQKFDPLYIDAQIIFDSRTRYKLVSDGYACYKTELAFKSSNVEKAAEDYVMGCISGELMSIIHEYYYQKIAKVLNQNRDAYRYRLTSLSKEYQSCFFCTNCSASIIDCYDYEDNPLIPCTFFASHKYIKYVHSSFKEVDPFKGLCDSFCLSQDKVREYKQYQGANTSSHSNTSISSFLKSLLG